MKNKTLTILFMLFALLITFHVKAFAETREPVKLPPPQTDGGKPLMQALEERASARRFSSENLPMQTLSDLLWSACGINIAIGVRARASFTGTTISCGYFSTSL